MELADIRSETEIEEKVDEAIKKIKDVKGYHKLRSRKVFFLESIYSTQIKYSSNKKVGPYRFFDLHIEVDNHLSISAAHQISDHVRGEL